MADLIQPEDKRFYIEKPDSSFSPRRNKAIIEETIKETNIFFKQLGSLVNDQYMDRVDILASYGKYRLNSGGSKKFGEYVGKKIQRELIGERIMSRVRVADTVAKMKGAFN